jgi:hypothetical protein
MLSSGTSYQTFSGYILQHYKHRATPMPCMKTTKRRRQRNKETFSSAIIHYSRIPIHACLIERVPYPTPLDKDMTHDNLDLFSDGAFTARMLTGSRALAKEFGNFCMYREFHRTMTDDVLQPGHVLT